MRDALMACLGSCHQIIRSVSLSLPPTIILRFGKRVVKDEARASRGLARSLAS